MIYPSKTDLFAYNAENLPRFLYHYTKVSSAIKILKTGTFLLRAPEKMNDPHEYRIRQMTGVLFHGNPSNQECGDAVFKHSNAIVERKNTVRIACFSMDKSPHWCIPSERGWNRMSMWTYYADSHRGVCLVFDRKQLEEDFNLSFSNAIRKCFCRSVQYVNEYELDRYEDMFWEPQDSYLDEKHINHLFAKSDCFAQEQEYRLLLVNKKLKGPANVRFSIKNAICGVITGDRFDKSKNADKLQTAIDACCKDISVFEMDYDMREEPLYCRAEKTRHINKVLKNL